MVAVGVLDTCAVVVVITAVAQARPSLPITKPSSQVQRPLPGLHSPLPLHVSSRVHTSVHSSPRQPAAQRQSPVMLLHVPPLAQAQPWHLSAGVNLPLQLQVGTPAPSGMQLLSPPLAQDSGGCTTHDPAASLV